MTNLQLRRSPRSLGIPHLFDLLAFPGVPELFRAGEPKIDLLQTEAEIVLKANLPGVSKENLKVIIDEETITLQGEMTEEQTEQRDNFFHAERFSGSYRRTIGLPSPVEKEKAVAKFLDGVLTVTVPKSQKGNRQTLVQID